MAAFSNVLPVIPVSEIFRHLEGVSDGEIKGLRVTTPEIDDVIVSDFMGTGVNLIAIGVRR